MTQLQGFEMVKAVHLCAEPFTLENDLLTPTFKLKRNVAKARFQTIIDDLYEKSGMGVVAGQKGLKQGEVRTGK
jgi:long-chain acyl-CoA synthetase